MAYLRDADRELAEVPTLLPEGIEEIHPKYAIAKRNRWMVERADTVVAYVRVPYGGAAQYIALAQRKGKNVINLFELIEGSKYSDTESSPV